MGRPQQKANGALPNGKPRTTINKKKTTRKAPDDSALFASYVPQVCRDVMKQFDVPVDEQVTVSGKSTRVLSGLIASLESQLTADAKRVTEFQKKKSILPASVNVALATRLPRSLTKYAIQEASNALTKWESTKKVATKK